MNVQPFNRVANEDDSSAAQSVKAIETEIVLYCKIGDLAGLEQCTRKEDHHQLEVRFETGHTSRVRRVTKDGVDSYTFTFKVKGGEHEGGNLVEAMIENNVEVDKDFYENFKKVASRELVKTRYVFVSESVTMEVMQPDAGPTKVDIPNVEYEIDVYKDASDQIVPMCKIDVEVDNIMNFLAKEFPDIKDIRIRLKVGHLAFKPQEVVPAASEEEDARNFIDAFWQQVARPLNQADPSIPAV